MGEKVLDSNRPLGRHRGPRRRSLVLRIRRIEHLHVLEFRYEIGNGLIQRKSSLLIEHHDGDTGDRLGHGANTKDMVGAHSSFFLAVRHSDSFEICYFRIAANEADATSDAYCA